MKDFKKYKCWIIGGIVGLLLFLYLNNFCIRYAIRERINAFFTCFSIQGSDCCAMTLRGIIISIIVWIMIPACFGAFIGFIISKFKRKKSKRKRG